MIRTPHGTHFFAYPLHGVIDCLDGQSETLCSLGVGRAVQHTLENLPFPVGQHCHHLHPSLFIALLFEEDTFRRIGVNKFPLCLQIGEVFLRRSRHPELAPHKTAHPVTYADLRNYLVRNSDEEGGRLYTRRLTQRLEKEILSAAPDEESFREFMRANVQSFTRVREKTRYYLCKYLYYDLTTRIDRYILALQKGHVREEVMESLSVFRGISVLKRKKQSPAQAREILENSAVSLGEVFDSFNYFYFGYATLDWMAVLIEACDSPEDLTERQKKAVLRSARRFSPALTAVSDKEALERVWQLEDEKEEELDRVYSRDSKTRGYQRGRGGENTLRKYLQGQLDPDRTTLISFLLFFGSEAELPEGQQITKDRLSSILKECGFAPLREQEEFDRFVIGFLQSRKSAAYLVEQVLAYAQEEKNFFLYKTWLNSDSAYDWMTKLLS